MSMTLAIEAGMASYVGVGAAVAADGAGSEAARAAAIEVAAIFFDFFERTSPSFTEIGSCQAAMITRPRKSRSQI